MRDLETMIRPLIDEPLHPAPSIDELRARNGRRRHRNRRRVAGGTAVVLVLAVALVVALLPAGSPRTPSARTGRLAAYLVAAGEVPDAVLEQVGVPASLTAGRTLIDQPPYRTGGKPVVLYVGGEYCPFCAVDRWALAVALAKFGTFTGVNQAVSSAANDVYPNLQSWSFEGASYSSSSFVFQPVEVFSSTPTSTGRFYTPLGTLTPEQRQAIEAHDTPLGRGGAANPTSPPLPFVDVGNRYVFVGSPTSPAPLEGVSLNQIGADLSTPASPVAQTVDGAANALLAALCAVAGSGSPPICQAPFILQAQAAMSSSGGP